MTYAELKTAIGNYLNRSDLDSMMDTFIQQTEAELNRKVRDKKMIKRATATFDSQYTATPTDWLEAINVEITSGDFQPLFQLSIESLDVYRHSITNIAGKPKYFSLVDDSIEVAPTPDASYTVQLTYYASIPSLNSTNTTNFISTTWPDIYLYGCLRTASLYLMDDDRAAGFTRLFDKALEELRMAQEAAAFGAGSLIPRRRTYGKVNRHKAYYWGNN